MSYVPEETISNLMMCIDQGIKLMSVNALPGEFHLVGFIRRKSLVQHSLRISPVSDAMEAIKLESIDCRKQYTRSHASSKIAETFEVSLSCTESHSKEASSLCDCRVVQENGEQ